MTRKPPEGGDLGSLGGDRQQAKGSTKPGTAVYEKCRVCLTPLRCDESLLCPDCRHWQPIL